MLALTAVVLHWWLRKVRVLLFPFHFILFHFLLLVKIILILYLCVVPKSYHQRERVVSLLYFHPVYFTFSHRLPTLLRSSI